MKAVLVQKPFELSIAEVPKPTIKSDDEVLIRVIAGGICGSDIGIFTGTNSLATYPRIIGHEFGGIIEAVGSKVEKLKIGDTVAVDPVRACGHCYACKHNRHNVCSTVEVTGVHRDGGFAEYVVAPASDCYLFDTNKIDRSLVCMVEPFSIGVQVNYRGEITADDTVLVMGSGPIGLTVMQVAKARGAKVMMTDILPERLERAKRCGADVVLDARNGDIYETAKAFSGGEGPSVAVDTVCSDTSIPLAMDLVCPAGRVVTMGLKTAKTAIAQVAFTKKEVTVYGTRLNNYRFPEVIRLFEEGKVHPEQLVTNVFPMEKVNDAIQLIREHPEQVCKVCLTF